MPTKTNRVVFELLPYQRDFMYSNMRFPCFTAAWGTGKTLCLIGKGLEMSAGFENNRGLIVRKNFTDLKESTIADFEQYTGMNVHTTHKTVIVPQTNSIIMFRHAKELTKHLIQNLNLGWFGIEQGEEFDTATIFDMLRGRMRRVLTPTIGRQKMWVKQKLIPRVERDWSAMEREERDEWEKRIKEAGTPFRQGYVIANAGGHNWIWRRWKYEQWPEHYLVEANSFDNPKLPQETLDDWMLLKEQSPRRFNRYVMNSWEDYDIEGSYYASLMSEALKSGRLEINGLWDPALPCYSFWDLGVRDSTAIWVVQFKGANINAVDYYENYGEPINHYLQWMDRQPYLFAAHYLPHDAKQRQQGRSIVETRYQMIKDMTKEKNQAVIVVEPHALMDGIDEVRGILPMCQFDAKCRKGVLCLEHYRRKINEALTTDEHTEFADRPLHDWASHGADAFRNVAISYRYHRIGGVILGYKGAKPNTYAPDGIVEDLLEL